MDKIVTVVVQFEEGTVAVWNLPANSPSLDQLEALLGQPDTIQT